MRETGLQYNQMAQRTAGVEIRAFLQSKMLIRRSNEFEEATRAASGDLQLQPLALHAAGWDHAAGWEK
jgi:hypothetical protein